MHTGSSIFLDALQEARVSCIFANLGSDHSGLVESLAKADALGQSMPRLITCPSEMVALSAAHGFAQVSGVAQAVVVHVECGTQSLAGAIHNAAKGRIPVLIFAGTSPFTQHGEMAGGRNEFIHWIQDVFDQRGIVRGYVKYDNEFRTPLNIRQVTRRALQFACSDPKGPVYLVGPREIMEQSVESAASPAADIYRYFPIAPAALPGAAVGSIAASLAAARRPLVITSYLGRQPSAVQELVSLCERLGVGVLESVPNTMNFPHDHPLYLGNRWNDTAQNALLAEADTVLIIDSDVPWIPLLDAPKAGATIYQIDVDPLKQQMPLSGIAASASFQADATTALRQINAHLEQMEIRQSRVDERVAHYTSLHARRARALRELEIPRDRITPESLTACLREHLDDETIVFNEGVSNYPAIFNHLKRTRPGSIFTSGGGSLGWNGGAAVGAKLASPESTIVALTGDGSYMLSAPSTVHWMARRYQTPFLQVIYNNQGWKSPKLSTLAVHPEGYASRASDIGVSFEEVPDYAGIAAAAGGAFAQTIRHPEELAEAVRAAFHAVRHEKRAAVLDVWLPPL